MGLREFSSNRYPKLWPPVEKYFPDGLVNSDGEQVTDLIDECAARDIHQEPCHARWVECPDREHQCFYMDRNNPVWREYLKAVIRIQIDAGVDGIQLDEAELPLGCLPVRRVLLQGLHEGLPRLPAGAAPGRAATRARRRRSANFHYGEWLLERGYDFKEDHERRPLFGDYYRYQCRAIKTHFAELADYTRAYGRERRPGGAGLGQLLQLRPDTICALADDVDLIITEMRNTTYRQPEWYRYVRGVRRRQGRRRRGEPLRRRRARAGGAAARWPRPRSAPAVALRGRRHGREHDRRRTAPGWAATDRGLLLRRRTTWRRRSRASSPTTTGLYATQSCNEVAVVYSVESTRALISRADASDNISNARDESVEVPYRVVTRGLADGGGAFRRRALRRRGDRARPGRRRGR